MTAVMIRLFHPVEMKEFLRLTTTSLELTLARCGDGGYWSLIGSNVASGFYFKSAAICGRCCRWVEVVACILKL